MVDGGAEEEGEVFYWWRFGGGVRDLRWWGRRGCGLGVGFLGAEGSGGDGGVCCVCCEGVRCC